MLWQVALKIIRYHDGTGDSVCAQAGAAVLLYVTKTMLNKRPQRTTSFVRTVSIFRQSGASLWNNSSIKGPKSAGSTGIRVPVTCSTCQIHLSSSKPHRMYSTTACVATNIRSIKRKALRTALYSILSFKTAVSVI